MHLSTRALSVRFDAQLALREVTLDLPEGSRVAFVGPPASGKTTLLKTLAGLRRPSSGAVLWAGDDVFALTEAERRARQGAFGMVFQTDALFDSSTVLENVLLPLHKRGVPPDEALTRARAVLAEVGLSQAENALPDALSGGMRKRAGLARALVARPEVIVADEPFSGLDPATGAQVARLLLHAAEGRTLLVAQAEPAASLPLTRWIVLSQGELRYDGPPSPKALAEVEA